MQCFATCVHGFPHTFVSMSWQIQHNQNCSFTLWVAKLILYVSFNPHSPSADHATNFREHMSWWHKVTDGHISVKYNCMHLQKLHSGRKRNKFQAQEFTVISLSSLRLAAAHSCTFQVLFSGHIMAESIASGSPRGRAGSFTCPCKLHTPLGRWMGQAELVNSLLPAQAVGMALRERAAWHSEPAFTTPLPVLLLWFAH